MAQLQINYAFGDYIGVSVSHFDPDNERTMTIVFTGEGVILDTFGRDDRGDDIWIDSVAMMYDEWADFVGGNR